MKLKLKRRKQLLSDRARDYQIFIDGEHAGSISYDGKTEFDLPAGKHEILLKVDWCSSNTLIINDDQTEINLSCYNTFGGWIMFIPFIPLYYITFGRKKYLTLTIM